eukprot:4571626-Pleurochrysis_carterae.AAC.2
MSSSEFCVRSVRGLCTRSLFRCLLKSIEWPEARAVDSRCACLCRALDCARCSSRIVAAAQRAAARVLPSARALCSPLARPPAVRFIASHLLL